MLRRLCDLIARRQVDAVALAGPAATRNLLDRATRDGGAGEVLNAFIEDVAAICLGSTVDDQAIEMAVSRLRSSIGHDLGGAELVQTVMKRGYRLAV